MTIVSLTFVFILIVCGVNIAFNGIVERDIMYLNLCYMQINLGLLLFSIAIEICYYILTL